MHIFKTTVHTKTIIVLFLEKKKMFLKSISPTELLIRTSGCIFPVFPVMKTQLSLVFQRISLFYRALHHILKSDECHAL